MATDDVIARLILALQYKDAEGMVRVSADDLAHLLAAYDKAADASQTDDC